MNTIKKIITNNITFIKYMFASGICFLLDLTLFTIFKLLFNQIGTSILLATISARIISSFVNYLLNRNKVFNNNEGKVDTKTLFKYYLLVIIQMLVSALSVQYLSSLFDKNMMVLFIPIATIIKIPVEIVLFMINFFVQKIFIFNNKEIKINPTVICFIMTLLTSIAFTLKLNVNDDLTKIFKQSYNNSLLLYMILFIGIFKFYQYCYKKYENKILFNLLALLFSLFMVLGLSYSAIGNANLVFGNVSLFLFSIIKLIGYYYFFINGINYLYSLLCSTKLKDISIKNKFIDMFNKHPMLVSASIILLCYLPYVISYYPAVMGYDPANQIKEVMGMHTRYMDSVILIDPNQTITNFNPVLHTLLLGGCFKLGHIIGNDNLGLFLYIIIQISIMVSILSYSISYMKKEGVINKLLFIVLAIYGLSPAFTFYAISTNKDTIFCAFVLLYTIKLFDLIKNEQNIRKYIGLFLCAAMVTLTRNNGFYTIILSLPFALIWLKGKRKQVLAVLVSIVMVYVGYNKVLLPHYKISNTSIREVLSVPFQQTARYAKYYPDDFSKKDIEVIDKILDYDTLGKRYEPELSDKVKNKYNINTTSEDLKEYFKVWGKGLIKRPNVYIDATIENTYGYFYPNKTSWYIYYKYNTKLEEAGFDYHYLKATKPMRDVLNTYGNAFPYIPLIGLLVNIGFNTWVYLFLACSVIVKKKSKYLIALFPALSFICVNIVGPANTYFRYALPYIMSLPVILCLLYKVFNDNKIINKRRSK